MNGSVTQKVCTLKWPCRKTWVKGFENYTGSDVKVQKTPSDPGTTLSKSESDEPKDIDKYS